MMPTPARRPRPRSRRRRSAASAPAIPAPCSTVASTAMRGPPPLRRMPQRADQRRSPPPAPRSEAKPADRERCQRCRRDGCREWQLRAGSRAERRAAGGRQVPRQSAPALGTTPDRDSPIQPTPPRAARCRTPGRRRRGPCPPRPRRALTRVRAAAPATRCPGGRPGRESASGGRRHGYAADVQGQQVPEVRRMSADRLPGPLEPAVLHQVRRRPAAILPRPAARRASRAPRPR